tara:strand:- start:306 stop:875 length:570 start_codon:yes stop_codon:yes gene_type:complete
MPSGDRGEIQNLPKNLKKIMGDTFFTRQVPGDNSCFYHAILYCTSSEYKQESCEKNKRDLVKKFRLSLLNSISEDYYKKELSGFVNKNTLITNLVDYNSWAGSIEWKIVVDYLKINIIMFRKSTDSIYCGWGIDNFNPSYKTIFILNIGDIHYDPIIFMNDNKIQSIFKSSTPIINKIIEYGKSFCSSI